MNKVVQVPVKTLSENRWSGLFFILVAARIRHAAVWKEGSIDT